MKYYPVIFILFIFLSGCDKSGSPVTEANKFVQREKMAAKSKLPINTKINATQSVTYVAANSRDPFELPINDEKTKKYPDTILKNMALDSLKLVGIVMNKNQQWAILRSNTGQLYKITVGMRIGMQQSLLTQIEQNQVKFTQEVNTPSGIQNKTVVMQLQESAK